VVHLLETFRPRVVVSVHAPLRCVNYDGPAADLAAAMAQHNGYPVRAALGAPTPGSLGSLVGIDQGIPIITLELPPGSSDEGSFAANLRALDEAVAHARERPT
jgi:protein MpaA